MPADDSLNRDIVERRSILDDEHRGRRQVVVKEPVGYDGDIQAEELVRTE